MPRTEGASAQTAAGRLVTVGRNASSLFDLTGRVAVITGGAGFLGRQHAEVIAAYGGIPVIVDLDKHGAEEAAAALGRGERQALAVVADLRRPRAVAAAVRKIVKEFGRIDILVNNAAMTVRGGGATRGYFSPFEQYPVALWTQALESHLTSMFLVTQSVGGVMARQRRGVVVNVASDLSLIAPDHRIYRDESFNTPISYSVCKTGIIGFTRYLATYWADKHIRVNALAPAGMYEGHSKQFVKKLSALIPMRRMATRNEYQGALLFLVSDASSFMTGATVVVDGGRTCW